VLGLGADKERWMIMKEFPCGHRRDKDQSNVRRGTMNDDYVMKISRLTVDKLGVRLYDRVSAVIAELIANSYDADATTVKVKAPMAEVLAVKQGNEIIDKSYTIDIEDDGIGMTPDEVNHFYLRVGAERRKDVNRGDESKIFHRKVMGRKGVGKLAPFGICQQIEILSSGGDLVDGVDENGHVSKGYLTAHLTLDRSLILDDVDADYRPMPGPLDRTVRPTKGTLIKLSIFTHRRVPSLEDLERQLSQRFGIKSPDWTIGLIDSTKTETDPAQKRQVGDFIVAKMDGTEIRFEEIVKPDGVKEYRALNADGLSYTGDVLTAGFYYEDVFYPVTGWVAYAKDPYKDDLMAGVRVYCRGKIAAQTNIFNRKAGFTGEHSIRSYLVGEIHANWLDEEEDLIQTDRRDILWSHELGQKFEDWGQKVISIIGHLSRAPLKKKIWDRFRESSNIEDRVDKSFPEEDQKPIRENAMSLAKILGQNIREDEVEDEDQVESLVQLALTFAPHMTLDQKLREAGEASGSPLGAMTSLLKTARVAELSSFGRVAYERVKVIEKVESLKDAQGTLESAFQDLITQAPWLINPQWSPITSNKSFATLKKEFEKHYEKVTGEVITLNDFSDPDKRADFVLSNQDGKIQIIEIKRPNYSLTNTDLERINTYIEIMEGFLTKPGNEEFMSSYGTFHITLVCDGLALSGVAKSAFEGFVSKGRLTHITWAVFLLNTRKMHEEFLNEAERQKENASNEL
jgi:hypothetical protein